MIPHYTAASLVSENKVLCTPASIDSIPVSASQEDHVSMGTTAARKARAVVGNVARVLAIELMCACPVSYTHLDVYKRQRSEPRIGLEMSNSSVW